jgi:tRNA nucleotidyltransferase/poly(A) polymerase
MKWSAVLDALEAELIASSGKGWLVGGCLRDALAGMSVHDVDVAITEEPLPVAERLAQRLRLAVVRLGHGTIRLISRRRPDTCLDLTRLHAGAHAEHAEHGDQGDILADLAHRDFTVNAMALPLEARAQWLALVNGPAVGMPDLIDPFGGRQHLMERRLVAVGQDTFYYDPGRIVRAARLRARLGLVPDAETTQLSREAASQMQALSPNRLREELSLLLVLPQATAGVALLDELGALPVLFAGLSGAAADHALATLRQLDRLMGVSAVSSVSTVSTVSSVSSDEQTFLALREWCARGARTVSMRTLALNHARGDHHGVSSAPALWQRAQTVLEADGDVERLHGARVLFWQAGATPDLSADALVVAMACILTRDDHLRGIALAARANRLIDLYIRRRENLIPTPLLAGKDVMLALGIPAGPTLGRLLRAVRLAQLEGKVSDHESALALARRLKEAQTMESSRE